MTIQTSTCVTTTEVATTMPSSKPVEEAKTAPACSKQVESCKKVESMEVDQKSTLKELTESSMSHSADTVEATESVALAGVTVSGEDETTTTFSVQGFHPVVDASVIQQHSKVVDEMKQKVETLSKAGESSAEIDSEAPESKSSETKIKPVSDEKEGTIVNNMAALIIHSNRRFTQAKAG